MRFFPGFELGTLMAMRDKVQFSNTNSSWYSCQCFNIGVRVACFNGIRSANKWTYSGILDKKLISRTVCSIQQRNRSGDSIYKCVPTFCKNPLIKEAWENEYFYPFVGPSLKSKDRRVTVDKLRDLETMLNKKSDFLEKKVEEQLMKAKTCAADNKRGNNKSCWTWNVRLSGLWLSSIDKGYVLKYTCCTHYDVVKTLPITRLSHNRHMCLLLSSRTAMWFVPVVLSKLGKWSEIVESSESLDSWWTISHKLYIIW